MRWISTLLASLLVTLITYLWAIPYFGAWFGFMYLPLEKQSAFTGSMLALAIGSCCLIALLRKPTVIFTIMAGGAAIGASSLISLAVKMANQPLPPELVKGGAIVGAAIGFCISLGTAIITVVTILLLEQWVFPKLWRFPEATLTLDPLVGSAHLQIPSPPKRLPQRTHRPSPVFKWALILVAGILLIPITKKMDWTILGKPAMNPQYMLTPSAWEGTITYKNKDYAFTLVFEEVTPSGLLFGYMDWPAQDGMPHIRLIVEGAATGNHLLFEDTDYIIGDTMGGSYDRKDVLISGNRMVGTDKNGTATLRAQRTSSAIPLASAMTAVGYRNAKRLLASEWGKHSQVCEGLNYVEEGRLAPSCWSDLAKQAKQFAFCHKVSVPKTRANCHVEVVWQTGEWKDCPTVQYALRTADCVNAAVAKTGNAEACRLLDGESFTEAYRICQAVASRDPASCARLPADFHGIQTQAECWKYLAAARNEPVWCEQLSSSGRSPAICHAFVQAHIATPALQYVSKDEIALCQSIRSPIEQDACYLKLASRGASALCSRVQHAKLLETCNRITSL